MTPTLPGMACVTSPFRLPPHADRSVARKGSLEAGKLADLVILSGEDLAVPEKAIERMRALATMVGGRFVSIAADYRP